MLSPGPTSFAPEGFLAASFAFWTKCYSLLCYPDASTTPQKEVQIGSTSLRGFYRYPKHHLDSRSSSFFLYFLSSPFSSTPEKKRKIPSQNCTWSKKGQSKKGSKKSTSKIQKKEREKSNTKHARERNTEKILLHFFPPSSIVFLMYTIGPTTRVSDRPSS